MKSHRPIVIAPQCPSGMGWANFNESDSTLKAEPSLPMKLLKELISKTLEEMPVDPAKIYITGLSMGGYGTYDAIMRYPELFAAAVPVCGGGDLSKAADIAHIPIWIFHAALDGVVNPVLSQKMLHALTEAGAHPGYTQYPETGHFAWIAAYSDSMMMDWLFKQHK
jgi:predicted peptidase